MTPGWYDDPFAAVGGMLRWWDGATWTSHVTTKAAIAQPVLPHGGFLALDPGRDLDEELAAARWMRVALPVWAVLTAAYAFISIWLFHDFRSEFHRALDGETTSNPMPLSGGRLAVLYTVGPIALVAQIALMIWLYRSATLARRAGLPARRDPVWAIVGFFVPIVNWWFPFQVAADSLAREDPSRRLVRLWWAAYLVASIGLTVVIFSSLFSASVALVGAIVVLVAAAATAYFGTRMVEAIAQAHRRILGRG